MEESRTAHIRYTKSVGLAFDAGILYYLGAVHNTITLCFKGNHNAIANEW